MEKKRYYPKCFQDSKQFQGWVSYARQAKPAPSHSYCEDCTPDFQAKMIMEKRCQYPGTLFHKSGSDLKGTASEGDWIGRRSALEVAKVRLLAWRTQDKVKLV
jgi:hypothetical protein